MRIKKERQRQSKKENENQVKKTQKKIRARGGKIDT